MSFGLYIVGFLIVVAGIAWGMSAMHVHGHWIAIVSVILIGIGVVRATTHTRMKDQL